MMYLEQLTEELHSAEKMYSELIQKRDENSNYIVEADREMIDLEHLLENRKHYKLTAPMLTKISLEISDVRIKRRDAKDENGQITILLPHYKVKIAELKQRVALLKQKEKQQLQPVFNPRSKVYERLGITMERVIIDKQKG